MNFFDKIKTLRKGPQFCAPDVIRLEREEEAAMFYKSLKEKLGKNPSSERTAEQFNITKQGLINGWVRVYRTNPTFMKSYDYIGE